MKNKGIGREYLIYLLILVFSLAILIGFLYKFEFKRTSEKEICKQSIILRSKQIISIEVGKALVPLNCKTQYIEIKTNKEEEAKKIIANALYDCWDMVGEGKLDFLGIAGIKGPVKKCLICSIIRFDTNLEKIEKFYNYLETNKIPGKDDFYATYLFQNQQSKFRNIGSINEIDLPTNINYAVIFVYLKGISLGSFIELITVGTAMGAGLGSFIPGIGTAAGGIAGAFAGFIANLPSIIRTYFAEIDKKSCNSAKGCVGLFLIPYTPETISKYCDSIESIS